VIPVAIVVLGLLAVIIRDFGFREVGGEDVVVAVDWDHPVIDVQFHDVIQPNDFVRPASMRFGLGKPNPNPNDPKHFTTRLVYDPWGRTCNVCFRVDRTQEFLWGVEGGGWRDAMRQSLGKDRDGHKLIGAKSVWFRPNPPISIAQIVEIVPGGLDQATNKRLLDTCLIRYDITNEDNSPHKVGLRFLLDTFIGSNDAVPFTIAGAKDLCNTMKSFDKPSEVPDFISALEKQDLNNPGTVAHISLKYGGGLEPPDKVTLGAWPAPALRRHPGARAGTCRCWTWSWPRVRRTPWATRLSRSTGMTRRSPPSKRGPSASPTAWARSRATRAGSWA
jgi:hypothetical protein